MSFPTAALEAPEVGPGLVEPAATPQVETRPPNPPDSPPEFHHLVAQLEQLQNGLEADRRLRCDAMNRLASLERILHRLETLSGPSARAKPVEDVATTRASMTAAPLPHALPPAQNPPAVWEATFIVREPRTAPIEAAVALAPVDGQPHLIKWLDYLVDRVGTEWIPRLLEHYHRVGWIHADQHAWLADLARQLRSDPAHEPVSLQTLRDVHEETRRILGIAPVASE